MNTQNSLNNITAIPRKVKTTTIREEALPTQNQNQGSSNRSRRPAQQVRSQRIRSITNVSANMPRNEQSSLREIVDTETERSAQDYLHCLVRPDECSARIPDSFSGDTALVSSVQVLKVPVYFTGMGADSGRFSCLVQPTLGSLSKPSDYKVALVQPTLSGGNYSWPTDLTLASNFVKQDNQGKDIRLDPYYQQLTQPPSCFALYYTGTSPTNTNCPFGPGSLSDGGGYGLNVRYDSGGGTYSRFHPPPGYYVCLVEMQDVADGTLNTIALTGVNGAVVNTLNDAQATDGSLSYIQFSLLIPEGVTNPYVSVTSSGWTTPISGSRISFARTFDDIADIPMNLGLVNKIRPVAMSVLTTYTGPTLLDGGNISTCFLPGGVSDSQFFTSNQTTTSGSLSSWEAVASVKGGLTHPIIKGSYAWYSPTSTSDYDMKTPSEALTHTYPTVVVSGQCVPGNTLPPDGSTYVRIVITSVYEIMTDSLLIPSRHQKGSQAEMDRVLNHLVGVPHVLENPDHVSFGRRILDSFRSAGHWIWKNRKTIGSAVGILGSLV